MAKKKTQKVPRKVFPVKKAEEMAEYMADSFQVQNNIFLSFRTPNSIPRKNFPSVQMYHDDVQYFDPTRDLIHLGSHGPLVYFEVETEEDYISAMEFLFGHENQHVRSTASIPYERGVNRCAQIIVEYIAKAEGFSKRFRNERDYEVFLESELRSKGIHVSMKTLVSLSAHLMNSIEDGRIERIRSLEFPGFARQRAYFRGQEWMLDEPEYVKYEDMNAMQHLDTLFKAIHCLATKNIYPKGFVQMYVGTPILDEVIDLMPLIAQAVLAGKTRKMADNVVQIAERLAPVVYDAVKSNATNSENLLAQLLAELLSKMFAEMGPGKMHATSEKEEGDASEQECAPLGISDLVIEVDDETFDKMMEEAKENGQSGPGIMVRRKNPKKEESEKGEQNGDGSGESNEENTDDKPGKSKSNKKGQKEDGENGESGQGNSQNDSNDGGNSQNGEKSNSDDANHSQSDSTSDTHDMSGEISDSSSKAPADRKEGNGSNNAGTSDGDMKDVLAAMEKAAKECRQEAQETISTINQSTVAQSKTTTPIVSDDSKPLSQRDVEDVCKRFEEVKRKYILDKPLPPVLNARAQSFRKRNERYFKSLSSPNVYNMSSGRIDSHRIYGLTFGETNVFRKVGVDKKFDGCVYVLIDNSGSMDGNKRKEACKAAAVIEEGFKGIIPMKIVAYDYSGGVIHEVIKGWDESQKMNCCWNFALHGRNGCCNSDNYDILIAQKELLSRPESKKLLIVLSDGAPSDQEATRKAIEETRKKGINVYGIYFEEGRIGSDANAFQKMYQKDYVCCPLNEVDDKLTELMIKFSRS